ncbi:MAG: amidohydrolase family protein [Pseudomonadota bacterium]
MLNRRRLLGSALTLSAGSAVPSSLWAAEQPTFKIYDTHAHFYTNDVSRYPLNTSGARNGADTMIAKAMANPMTPDAVFKLWDDAGVELGCGVQYNSTYGTDNSYLLDVAKQHPDRIMPVVILSPIAPETPQTLIRMAKENQISGVRFTGSPNAEGEYVFLSAAAEGAWQAANELGLAVILMPGSEQAPSAMARIAQFAERYPNVKIVLDHIGFPRAEVSDTFGLSPEHLALAAHKNVYYKYTTLLIERLQEAALPANDFLHYVVEVYGADHLVWGSDVGNSEGDFLTFVHHALDSASGLSLDQQKAIFYDTAKTVFIPGGRGLA